ncbi:hypothetical protein QJS10_CPB14g00095 [Acorus calamus]|uniref:Uncharacterized protein n=1 Tax=Acorus calamus TaxID=4465 RepID=A0AAV9DDJ8_ACOCL|nr:hypothetical protein QJS10_CPB14g00095 [Acorus calamus]
MHNHHDHTHLPCLHCHPHSFIRMVQHLIERCLILHMSRDDCVEALARHANIRPLVTLTDGPVQKVSRFRRNHPWF